jgi:hypothetical protein
LKANYNFKINSEEKLIKFLNKNNYLTFAMNYLETFKTSKIGDLESADIISFVKLDGKINFITLVYF